MTSVSSAQLQKFLVDLDDATKRLGDLVESIPSDLAIAHPDPATWSVADNIAHLSLTTEAFLPLLEAASNEAKEKGLTGFGPFGMGMVARVLVWFIEPNTSIKTKTKPAFEPVAAVSVDDEVRRFLDLQEKLARSIVAFDGLAIDKLKVVSPFDAKVKYTVVGAFAIIGAHQRRHLLQAERAAAAVK